MRLIIHVLDASMCCNIKLRSTKSIMVDLVSYGNKYTLDEIMVLFTVFITFVLPRSTVHKTLFEKNVAIHNINPAALYLWSLERVYWSQIHLMATHRRNLGWYPLLIPSQYNEVTLYSEADGDKSFGIIFPLSASKLLHVNAQSMWSWTIQLRLVLCHKTVTYGVIITIGTMKYYPQLTEIPMMINVTIARRIFYPQKLA